MLPVPDARRCATLLLRVPFWNGGAGVAVHVTLVISTVEGPEIRSPLAMTVSCHGPLFCRTRTCTVTGAALTVGVVSGLADTNVMALADTDRSSFCAYAGTAIAHRTGTLTVIQSVRMREEVRVSQFLARVMGR